MIVNDVKMEGIILDFSRQAQCNHKYLYKREAEILPWQSVVKTLCAMQGAQVQFLVEELTSHMPCSTAKKI